MGYDDTKTVVTPEQVAVTYRIAGVGTRFAAILVDSFAQAVLLLVIALLMLPLGLGVWALFEEAAGWMLAVLIVLVFLIVWGYFIFWETVWSGRTPGKRLTGIRVMRDGGYPIDFRAAFLRNICRYVDFLPAGYGLGALFMFASKDSKRLGDYVAGTIVVVDSRRPARPAQPEAEEKVEYRLLGDPSLLNLRAITREQFMVIDRFLGRREELLAGPRAELAQQIAAPLMDLVGIPRTGTEYPYEEFLAELAAALRQRADR
jgi:uncharacterized RDD family membrane protein YckC